ncbi:hypothetical protein MTO96_051224 [Rhipicephalus appendiculatus]
MQPHGESRVSSFLLGVCRRVLEGSAPGGGAVEGSLPRARTRPKRVHESANAHRRKPAGVTQHFSGVPWGTIVHTRLIYVLTAERLRLSASAFLSRLGEAGI